MLGRGARRVGAPVVDLFSADVRKRCPVAAQAFDPVKGAVVKPLFVGLLMIASLSAAQDKRKFTGTITDDMCALADHSRMRMGSTDAECAIACVSSHAAMYVLYDGKEAYYRLSDQRTPEKFAGKKVTVVGTLDAKTRTIQVDSMTGAK
jgi:hypothetical protein